MNKLLYSEVFYYRLRHFIGMTVFEDTIGITKHNNDIEILHDGETAANSKINTFKETLYPLWLHKNTI